MSIGWALQYLCYVFVYAFVAQKKLVAFAFGRLVLRRVAVSLVVDFIVGARATISTLRQGLPLRSHTLPAGFSPFRKGVGVGARLALVQAKSSRDEVVAGIADLNGSLPNSKDKHFQILDLLTPFHTQQISIDIKGSLNIQTHPPKSDPANSN